MNTVIINKDGCEHTVHTEEQLNLFLSSGWMIKEQGTKQAPKRKPKKVTE